MSRKQPEAKVNLRRQSLKKSIVCKILLIMLTFAISNP